MSDTLSISREQHNLFVSVYKGELENVRSLLKQGVSPNFFHGQCRGFADDDTISNRWCRVKDPNDEYHNTDAHNITCLHMACIRFRSGGDNKIRFEIVKELVEYGADLNPPFQESQETAWSPLVSAICSGSLELVKYLIDKGADINSEDRGFWSVGQRTPLMYAIYIEGINNDLMIDLLMQYNPDLTLRHSFGHNALGYAFTENDDDGKTYHSNIVKKLLTYKFDINNVGNGETALHGACRRGDIEIINLLLDMGADPNVKSEDGYAFSVSSLKYHLAKKQIEEVHKIFKERGVDVNQKCEKEELDICRDLMANGISVFNLVQKIKDYDDEEIC